ncbi:helix-turn-helix transcriptional regulator [Streptomyces pseudoechinosporeus]
MPNTQPEFGRRIRELRRQVGMSQAQLAGPQFSASYVSLVESGKRVPSPDIVATLADRLGVTPQSLQEDDDTASPPDETKDEARRIDLVGLLFKARKEEEEGFPDAAVKQLTEILDKYGEGPHHDVLWEVRWALARIHEENGRADESRRLLRELAADEYTRSTPDQMERVARYLAELNLRNGGLPEALRFAHLAWAIAETHRGCANWARAGTVLVSACTWSGFQSWGREVSDLLVAHADLSDRISRPLRNAVYLESAKLYCLAGDNEQARVLFERALEQIDPRQDIVAWATGQYYLAMAELDLDQGLEERVTDRVAKARPVIEVLGDPGMRVQLALLEGRLALTQGDHDRARFWADTAAEAEPWPATHEVGMCLLFAARIYRSLGDMSTAAAMYRRAADMSDEAGTVYLCKLVWRELAELQEQCLPQDS